MKTNLNREIKDADPNLSGMSLEEIKKAVDEGKTVHWNTLMYKVIKDRFDNYWITCPSTGSKMGLDWVDGEGNTHMNASEKDFFIG